MVRAQKRRIIQQGAHHGCQEKGQHKRRVFPGGKVADGLHFLGAAEEEAGHKDGSVWGKYWMEKNIASEAFGWSLQYTSKDPTDTFM